MIKIDALVQLGDRKNARAAFEELRALKPHFSCSYIDWIPFEDRSLNHRFAESVSAVASGHSHMRTADSSSQR
jgi:hypothetical protein